MERREASWQGRSGSAHVRVSVCVCVDGCKINFEAFVLDALHKAV